MKKLIYFGLLCHSFIGYSQEFYIDGNTSSPYNGKLYLLYNDKIDSTTVTNGSFFFQGKIEYPTKANLSTKKDNKETGFFILEPSSLSVDIAIENNRKVYFKGIGGSESVKNIKDFLVFKNKYYQSPNLGNMLFDKLKVLFQKSPKSQYNGMLLAETMADRNVTMDQSKMLLKILDRTTQDKEDLAEIDNILESMSKTQIGAIFPDIEFQGTRGVEKLYNHRKKFTLVAFSSSDCINCVELDRKMAAVYKDFKSHGLSIYEVYLDESSTTWKEYLHKEGIGWTAVIAPKRKNDATIKSLGITIIPTNFLLDATGKIIGINVTPNNLAKKIQEYKK
ncbi:MAG: TlpA disulfide reductase family protein [Capnocytophaga sp.]|nr:TlpA disulfide reductase family protein [Capnocytophaga sp.]